MEYAEVAIRHTKLLKDGDEPRKLSLEDAKLIVAVMLRAADFILPYCYTACTAVPESNTRTRRVFLIP
jgi:hypothetical protein